MFVPDLEDVKCVLANKGYVFFESGDFNINIIGIRCGRTVTNLFDDTVALFYKTSGIWVSDYFPFTTDPGRGPMENPGVGGRAVLKPGQYRGAYALGLHKGKESALVQVKPVTVYRDCNGDRVLDYERPETGLFGINIHWSSKTGTSVQVDTWSEGCQVGTGAKNRERFLNIIRKSVALYGNRFTYTLLEQSDFSGCM